MTNEDLKKHYKQLLEAADAVPEVVPEPDGPQGPVTPDQPEEVSPGVSLDRQKPMSFVPNPHRFKFQQGDEVAFYDERGTMVTGTIAGDQIANRYNVVDAQNVSHDIMKNELFFPPGAAMADQASGAQSSA